MCIENEVRYYCFIVVGSYYIKWKVGVGGEKDRVIEDGGRFKDLVG